MVARNTRRRRALKFAIGLILILLIGLGGAGWLLFQRIPAWYTPTQVAAADLQSVRDDFGGLLTFLGDRISKNRPFELRITQDRLNAWLIARRDIWPRAEEWIPPMIDEPFIAFEPDRVILAGTAELGGIRTVVSASCRLSVDEKGLAVRLFDVRAGSLPVPDAWVGSALGKMSIGSPRRGRSGFLPPAPEEFLTGTHVPPEFLWPSPRRSVRILRIRLERGAITLWGEPLPCRDQHSR